MAEEGKRLRSKVISVFTTAEAAALGQDLYLGQRLFIHLKGFEKCIVKDLKSSMHENAQMKFY